MDDPPTPPSSPVAGTEPPKEKKPRPILPLKIHRHIERLEKRIEKLEKENTELKEKLKTMKKANTRIRKLP